VKSLVKRKKSFSNKKNLILTLFFLSFVFGIGFYFRDNLFNFLNVNNNHNSPDVLAASQISLTRVNRYDIEFVDLDGQTKSIRPKGCVGFDIPRDPGVVSTMKTLCERNYNLEFPNPPFLTSFKDSVWTLQYSFVALPILTSKGNGLRNMNIFPARVMSYENKMEAAVHKYRPMLQDIEGRPVMFYYGGIHEINTRNNSTYLLTRFYDSGYYTRAFNHGDIPNLTYKLFPFNTFFYASNYVHNTNEQSCFVCSQNKIYGKDSSGKFTGEYCAYGATNTYCPGLGTDRIAWTDGVPSSNGGKLSPELFVSNWDSNKAPSWDTTYANWTFRGNRDGYRDPNNRAALRYQNNPYIDSVNIEVCSKTNECAVRNPTNNGALFVKSKNSYRMGYAPGYGQDFRINCIGKLNDNSCRELVIYGADRDPTTNFSYTSFWYFNGSPFSLDKYTCYSSTSSSTCVFRNELLHDDRWVPYSNISKGYESPGIYYDYDRFYCEIFPNRCVRAIDWNDVSGKITFYNSYLRSDSIITTLNKPANFPPTNSNISFTSEYTSFSIKMNPPTSGNYGSMDIYKYGINIGDGKPYSFKYSYNFTAQSPFPKYYREDEVSVTYSRNPEPFKSPDIDIMFSSLNANPANYSKNELRVIRLKNGLSDSDGKQSEIIDITDKFNFTGIYPLTFQRYFEDGTTGSAYPKGTEYYVFVDRDDVFHSVVPESEDCVLNIDNLNIQNVNPNSFYNGLKLPNDNINPHLVINSNKPIYCKDAVTNIDNTAKPITAALVTFYDPINLGPLVSFPATSIDNLSVLNFGGALNNYFKFSFPDGMKLNFDLNFSMGSENVLVNRSSFSLTNYPNIFPKGFTVYKESDLNLIIRVSNSNYSFNEGTTMTITKNNFVSPVKNLDNFINKSFPINISSTNPDFSDLFYDHNLLLNSITSRLEDSVNYKICFSVNVVTVTSSNPNFLQVSKNQSDSNCINLKYLNSNVSKYNLIGQTVTIDLEEKVSIDLGNIEFNGNVFTDQPNISSSNIFNTSNSSHKGVFVTSGNFNSTSKFINNTKLGFSYLNAIGSLNNFSNFSGNNFNKFNFLYRDLGSQVESTPLIPGSYITLNPSLNNSNNKFEIINISKGRGVVIDLTNSNITKNFDKYVLVNLDSINKSRIKFKLDCLDPNYSLICSGNLFNFKGSILGSLYLEGNVPQGISNSKFIRIHENASIVVSLANELRSKKYPTITSTLVNLKYE
jgi:hypothetical protein